MIPLGPITAWNRRLHAIRVLPLVRANGILVVVLVTIAIVAGSEAWDAARSSSKPEPTALDRILATRQIANPNVEVEGLVFFPNKSLAYPERGKYPDRPARYVYVPMLDPETKRVLLVRFPGDIDHGEPRTVVVTGMLEPPDAGVARQLNKSGWRVAGIPVEQRYILLAGITPKPLWLLGPITVLAVLLAALFVAAMFVPQKTPEKPES